MTEHRMPPTALPHARTGGADAAPAPTGLSNCDAALERYGAKGRAWLDGMWQADPLADAVVNDPGGAGPALRAIRGMLDDGAGVVPEGAPASARALAEQITTDPEWLERDRLDRAADVLVRYSAQWGLVLGAASLLAGADNWIAARPLLMTGRYGHQPAVRSIEVGEWLSEVVRPGGMEVGGPGFARTVRVRLIHAHVRRHIGSGADWDLAAWGVPVPQPYMAFTLAEFGHISLAAMEHLGVVLRPDELDDIYHLWRYVGFLIGVDPALNPVEAADQIAIEELYHLTSPGPDDYSREFVRALTEDYLAPQLATLLVGPDRLRQDVSRRLMYGMSRVFLGDRAADALAIPDGPAKHVVRALRPGLVLADRARLRLLGRDRVTAQGYLARDRELARLKAEHAMTHDLVDAVPGAVGHTT
ncbi:oxygenase MpaB family protein [Nocardioides sambongensis]|uniref:oxygenase MpaB family protein n=1 Tax=Nocardioides sambongensis TaxID=2589074 RepID=UPI0018C8B0CD|nr:oxygenase MpaB family protein [Nocardioides sambongensis]